MLLSKQLSTNQEEKISTKASTQIINLREPRRKQRESRKNQIEIEYPSVQLNTNDTITFNIKPGAIFTFPVPSHDDKKRIYSVGEFLDNLKLYNFDNHTGLMQFMRKKVTLTSLKELFTEN